MRHAVPVKHLLLLLRSDAIVLVHEVKKWALWLLEGCIGARLEVAQIRKDALLEFFRILHGPSESLESEGEASHDICAGDVKQIVPARH